MIIKFLTSELLSVQRQYKQILIGKMWHSSNAYNLMTGNIGVKKKDADWNFSEVSLHPQDKIFLKVNRWKKNLRDPEYLLYVENQPNGSRIDSEKGVG